MICISNKVCLQSELPLNYMLLLSRLSFPEIFFVPFHPLASIAPNLGILEVRLGGCGNNLVELNFQSGEGKGYG